MMRAQRTQSPLLMRLIQRYAPKGIGVSQLEQLEYLTLFYNNYNNAAQT